MRAVQAAVAAEEAKREEALERQAAEAGETKWFLSFRPEERDGGSRHGHTNGDGRLRVMSASYSGLDRDSVSAEWDEGVVRPPAVVGRRSFGRFNRALEVSGFPFSGENVAYYIIWLSICMLMLSLL